MGWYFFGNLYYRIHPNGSSETNKLGGGDVTEQASKPNTDKCALCGRTEAKENTQRYGWIPQFMISEHQPGNGPVCRQCADQHLEEASMPVLKAGHGFTGYTVPLVDNQGNTMQIPVILSAGKMQLVLPDGDEISVILHNGEILVYHYSSRPQGGVSTRIV